ncbi:MAG: hypothetical protein Q9M23_02980 [Mariprofundaceae bacterium]|nr:hypothetical protein [Mariprofundaceae bacterium]
MASTTFSPNSDTEESFSSSVNLLAFCVNSDRFSIVSNFCNCIQTISTLSKSSFLDFSVSNSLAIQSQLIKKYLSDADNSHGICFVGWYGNEYFGPYKRELKRASSGSLASSPDEFEEVLQTLADIAVRQSPKAIKVKAMVADLRL